MKTIIIILPYSSRTVAQTHSCFAELLEALLIFIYACIPLPFVAYTHNDHWQKEGDISSPTAPPFLDNKSY